MGNHDVAISVLMAVYNTSRYLREAIDSVRFQTFQNWELICVDDGSTDDSLEVLRSYEGVDKRIRVFTQAHSGLASAARNAALARAVGSYLIMLDSDDFLSTDALARAHARAVSTEADAVLLDVHLFHNGTRRTGRSWIGFNGNYDALISGPQAVKLSLDWSIHGLALWRAELFRSVRWDESGMNGDELTTRILFHHCALVGFCSGAYHYREHSASTTHTVSLKRLDWLETSRRLHDMLLVWGYDSETLERSLLVRFRTLRARLFFDEQFADPERSRATQRIRDGFELLRASGLRGMLLRRGGAKNAMLAAILSFRFDTYRRIHRLLLCVRNTISCGR